MDRDLINKKVKILNLLLEIPYDYIFLKFFDENSNKMLDEKIEVLTDLKNGKQPIDIPNYYKVLEKYPKDGEMWD